MKYFFWIAFGFLIFLNFSCKLKVADACGEACEYSQKCITDLAEFPVPQDKLESFSIQCKQTCTMIRGEMLGCYKDFPNSCMDFYNCLITNGFFR